MNVLLLIVIIFMLALIILLLLGTSIPYQAIEYKPINTTQGYISRGNNQIATVSTSNDVSFLYQPKYGFFQALLPEGVRCLRSLPDESIVYDECIPSSSTSFQLTSARITQGEQCLVTAGDSQIRLGNCESEQVLAIVPRTNWN